MGHRGTFATLAPEKSYGTGHLRFDFPHTTEGEVKFPHSWEGLSLVKFPTLDENNTSTKVRVEGYLDNAYVDLHQHCGLCAI